VGVRCTACPWESKRNREQIDGPCPRCKGTVDRIREPPIPPRGIREQQLAEQHRARILGRDKAGAP
jgi:hypothetical protein